MQRLTRWFPTKEDLQFAFDQVEKYSPGRAVYRQGKYGTWAIYLIDKWGGAE